MAAPVEYVNSRLKPLYEDNKSRGSEGETASKAIHHFLVCYGQHTIFPLILFLVSGFLMASFPSYFKLTVTQSPD